MFKMSSIDLDAIEDCHLRQDDVLVDEHEDLTSSWNAL